MEFAQLSGAPDDGVPAVYDSRAGREGLPGAVVRGGKGALFTVHSSTKSCLAKLGKEGTGYVVHGGEFKGQLPFQVPVIAMNIGTRPGEHAVFNLLGIVSEIDWLNGALHLEI